MHSPVHPEVNLRRTEIEPGLAAFVCPKSGGVWIPLEHFHTWKDGYSQRPETLDGDAPAASDDSKRRALICPESGRLLIRYRVGHGLTFHIDRSAITGGVWLDKGEWEALKNAGLHRELHRIFTAPYQRQIRDEEHEQALRQTFSERIGAADFAKVTEFKAWLTAHPKARDIQCFLMHEEERGEGEAEAG